MFKIGEFSKLTHVSVRMLRFYDEQDLLHPSFVDASNGYRFYTAQQITQLNKILFLRDLGFQTAEMKSLLVNWNKETIQNHLAQKQVEIISRLQEEQNKFQKLKQTLLDLEHDTVEQHVNITIKNIPSYHVLSLRNVIPTYYDEGALWEEMFQFANQEKIACDEAFSLYHDMEYKEHGVDVELCVVVKELKESKGNFHYRTLPQEDMMASFMVYGPFSNIAKAYIPLANWLSQHSIYKISGPDRQIVHRGPWNEEDSSNYLIEILIPLAIR